MALTGKLAAQVSKLFSRRQAKFLGEQKDILATEPSERMSGLEYNQAYETLLSEGEPTVMQHSTTLPEFEGHSALGQNQSVDAASWWPAFQDEPSAVVPVNEWDRPPIPEKLRRKLMYRKPVHGSKPDEDRPAPLTEMKPFLDLRFRLDERFKLIDDVTNDIVSKDALLNTLSNPQSEEVGQIFSFIGDNKTKPFLSKSQTKKYNRPWRNVDRPTTFLPREEEILFDVKEFNLPANEILVEDGILWQLQHDLHDLISDPKYRRAGQNEEYYDKLKSSIDILSDVLKTPAFKKEVRIEDVEYTRAKEMLELKKILEKKQEQAGVSPLSKSLDISSTARKKFIEDVGKMEIPSDPSKKATRFYRQINIDDFVRIAKDKRKEEIRKNPNQISETFQWGDDVELKDILQEGIVESPEIGDELMFYSSLERDGFIQGGSQELIREGASLSVDTLLSFRKFSREDLNRMFYVDLPEDMSANDIVNLSSIDYLIPEDKDGIIFKPNVYNEKEIFVTKEGGFRDKLNVRRLNEDEKRELLRLNRAHTKAVTTTESLQEMRSLEWGVSYYTRTEEGMYVPTTISGRLPPEEITSDTLRTSIEGMRQRRPPNQAALENIVDTFTFLHKQLTDPEEYVSKVFPGGHIEATIRTLSSGIEAYEKQLQGNLIQASRHISDLTNQLRKLKGNKSASLDIIKQFYFRTPTYQLVGDMVVMKKLKQRLVELTEVSKQYKALSPKGIEALIGLPTNADNLRQKLKTPLKEALEPVFEKPLDYKRFSPELENFNNTLSILEEIDDPTFLKIYILNDILKMRDSTRKKFKHFSYEVKNEHSDKLRLSPSDVGKEHAERFKKANSSKLTKLWSDYNKANEVTLEFMLKNFGYAMGGVVDMRNGGTVGAAVVAASLMASGGQASSMENGGDVDPAYSLYEEEKLMRPTTSIRGKSGWKTREYPHPWERGSRETWAKQRKHHMSQAKKHYKDFKNWSVFAKKMGQVPPTAYVLPFDEARAFSPVLMSGERIYKGKRVQQDIPFKTSTSTMTKAELAEVRNKGTYTKWRTRLAKQAQENFKLNRSLWDQSYGPDFGAVGIQEKSSRISGDTPTDQKTIIGFKGEGSDPSIPTSPQYAKPIPVGQEPWRTKWERQDLQDWSTPGETVTYTGKRGGVVDMRNGGVVRMVHGGPVHSGPVIDYTTPEEKEFDKDYDAVKQMEALLAKRQAAVDYGGLEQPDPMPDAVPPVPKMNPLRAKQREIKERVMASTLKEIADAEGTGDQGYNIVFGTPRGESSSIFINPPTSITNMTLKELDKFQRKLVNATRDEVKGVEPGHGTSAVGKYQVTMSTLELATKKLGIKKKDWDKVKYSPELQEQIGRVLLEHRGLDKMLEGKLTEEQYRIILSNEWASIPGKKKKVGGQPTPANVGRIEGAFRKAINELKVSRDATIN